ncbi:MULTISPECIES: hypothetical protein [unclassified Sphingopyxis]|uniref:hypothetical protein n=1 Tax=unclassified Sphingopyxis TaxID=2614943 RepID=UPI0024AE29F1|nr:MULTISPECIES: hypothetical protein [unclassified Sphingopyxis]
MELNNREIATLIWLAILAVVVFRLASVRIAFRGLLSAFAQRQILMIYGVAGLYVGACVAFLSWWGIWTTDNLKSTILWSITFLFVTLIDANRIDEDKTYFGRTIRDTLGLTGLLVFIGGLESFSLSAELLFVPVISFVSLTHQVGLSNPAHKPASNCLGALLVAAGIAILTYSIHATWLEWAKFDLRKNLSELLVPILLSLLFLPFLYALSIFLVYDRNFTNIAYALPDKGLARFARRRALFAFRTDLNLLKRWRHIIVQRRPSDRLGVVQAIAQAMRERDNALRRSAVDAADGWSPYAAVEFLASEGFSPPDYLWYFDGYRARVTHKFGDDPLANYATYYVEGDEAHATLLTLELWIWGKDDRERDEQRFAELIAILMDRAVGAEARAAFRDELDPEVDGASLDWNGYRFRIEAEEPNPTGRYSLDFSIVHPSNPENTSS